MMLPMSIRCNTCGEYLYRGKKFNSIKETVLGEDYLGIKIYRFYMRCTRCSSEFTIKTDPKNCDYETENNCSRNFEPWRQQNEEIEKLEKEKKEEEGDAMKRLENRTLESKIEMDILDGLDNIKSLNAKHANVSYEKIFEERNKKIQEEEEELLKNVVFKNSGFIRRIKDEEEDDQKKDIPEPKSSNNENNEEKKNDLLDIIKKNSQNKKKISELSTPTPQIVVKKKRKVDEVKQEEKKDDNNDENSIFGLLSKPTKKIDNKKVVPKKTNTPKTNNSSLSSLIDY